MRLLLPLLILAVGCAPRAGLAPPPERALLLPGVRLEAPAGDGWATAERGAERVVLARTAPGVEATLLAQVLPAAAPGDDAAFLRAAEAREEEAVRALEMLSVHYNHTTLGGAACLAYDGSYRDAQAADPAHRFRTLKGYVCRQPADATRAVRLELTLRSASRPPPEVEPLLGTADAFFRSAVFGR